MRAWGALKYTSNNAYCDSVYIIYISKFVCVKVILTSFVLYSLIKDMIKKKCEELLLFKVRPLDSPLRHG